MKKYNKQGLQYFHYECTWWKLFVMNTEIDKYVFNLLLMKKKTISFLGLITIINTVTFFFYKFTRKAEAAITSQRKTTEVLTHIVIYLNWSL
jgi:hypothetical protein